MWSVSCGAGEPVREGGRLGDTAASELDEDPGGIPVFQRLASRFALS